MVNKHHIESLLKINGLETSSPESEIRSILISARFNKDEVEAALLVLRQDCDSQETQVDGLHKVFRTDVGLKPAEISRLLGVDVIVRDEIAAQGLAQSRGYSIFQIIILWTLSVLVALGSIMIYMYSNQIGFFHPGTQLVNENNDTSIPAYHSLSAAVRSAFTY